jgi:hypothetical protein
MVARGEGNVKGETGKGGGESRRKERRKEIHPSTAQEQALSMH